MKWKTCLLAIFLAISAGARAQELTPLPPLASDLQAELAALRRRIEELEGSKFDDSSVVPAAYQNYAANQDYPAAQRLNRGYRQFGPARRAYRTLHWNGFIQLDSGYINQSEENVAAVGLVQSQTGLRRVRLRASGELAQNTDYIVDLDFAASGHPSFRDVKFTLHEQEILQNTQIGYFQQPFGFDAMTSGRELLLLERQLPFAFAPFRQTGIGSYGTALDKRMSWSFSGFRYPTNSFGISQGNSGGWGYAQRITALPIYAAPDRLLHVGASYSFIDPADNNTRFAIQPGFFVVDPDDFTSTVPNFVDTGNMPTVNLNLVGAEAAVEFGSLNLQSEVIGAFVRQQDGPFLGFHGVSAKAAYVLTGEVHPYDRERGVFTRVLPRESGAAFEPLSGAWEAVGAWSMIDLNSNNIAGGRLQTTIVGFNRYLTRNVKIQFNVIRAVLDSPLNGRSTATLAGLRGQAEF